MFAKERQAKIINMINKNGAVTTAGLVKLFGISAESIRRDLIELERQQKLSRVHGGAVRKNTVKPFLKLQERNMEQSRQKKSLAAKAVQFVSDGDIISVDAGSTATYFAEEICGKFSNLTVITYSLDVANILKDESGISLILCGGYYHQNENAFCGSLALDMLEKLYVQKTFICPSAVSLEFGICDFDKEMYQMQRKMVHTADNVYILADSSKYEKNALLKIEDMKDTYSYITDGDISEELMSLYEKNNIRIFKGKWK